MVLWESGSLTSSLPTLRKLSLSLRKSCGANVFNSAINVGATFNRDLMRQIGESLGEEFRGKGVNVALGPMMNIVRVPAGGRNWEGCVIRIRYNLRSLWLITNRPGADPFLTGEHAYETIIGIQSKGVQGKYHMQ